MVKKLLLILTTFIFISCGNEKNENLYKTTSGEYASKTGNFVVKFPSEPSYSVSENQIGSDQFQIHTFRSALGPNKIFTVEYIDYPSSFIKSMTDEEIYTQGIANFSNNIAETFTLEFQEPIEQHGIKGQYFVFNLKQTAKDKGIKGHIVGMLFRNENLVYTVTYMGRNDNKTGEFMDSFRFIK